MSQLGFNERATISTIEGKFLQNIRCKCISKLKQTGSFMGGGKASNNQYVELSTKTTLKSGVEPMTCNVKYDGTTYLLMGMPSHDTSPIKGQIKQRETVLILQ